MGHEADAASAQFGKRRRVLLASAGLIALAIFAADLMSPLQGAVAVLYIAVVLLVAQASGRRAVIGAGLGCAWLALIAFAVGHWGDSFDSAYVRLGVSLVAIAAATLLSLRDHFARTTLAEQARILELSHDTVIIRDAKDRIVYWNDGAENLYGWPRSEALGKRCDELLLCEFPLAEVERALREKGSWSGELTRTRRDGTRIVLASRWLLRRDPEGNGVGVIESSADVTEQQRSERRYGTIFNGAGLPIWESDWSATRHRILAAAPEGADLGAWLLANPGVVRAAVAAARISEANPAARALFEARDDDELLRAGAVDRYAAGTEPIFAEILAALAAGEEMIEKEMRCVTLRGRTIDVVARVRLLPEGEPWSRVLVMGLDVTERNEARARLEQASAELAHAARVSTLGQLAASIAHEVNQPLSAIINYGKSGKRWLARDMPEIGEIANCLDHIVANGSRAAEVIARVRSLARKAAPEAEPLALAELIEEAVILVEREARGAGVIVSHVAEPTPMVLGDRVQVQQVLVNLLINAIQAMRAIEDRPRALRILLAPDGGMARVAVEDSGTGIDGEPQRIFEPFFTTKGDGMGMGLSICRAIIEAQGGRIVAANNPGHGATVAFTLPVHAAEPRADT